MNTYIYLPGTRRTTQNPPAVLNSQDWPHYDYQPFFSRPIQSQSDEGSHTDATLASLSRRHFCSSFHLIRNLLLAVAVSTLLVNPVRTQAADEVFPVGPMLLSAEQLQTLIARMVNRQLAQPLGQGQTVKCQPYSPAAANVAATPATPQISDSKPSAGTSPEMTPAAAAEMPGIHFTAVDGREVDLASLRGKVVLIDFWATWCGPCMSEIPHVVDAYNQYHEQGFEVIGISFDTSKAALERATKAKDMPWPQYFDAKGWQNDFGVKFGIRGIPTMWLIDQEGRLVTKNARVDLAGQVAKLLAAESK